MSQEGALRGMMGEERSKRANPPILPISEHGPARLARALYIRYAEIRGHIRFVTMSVFERIYEIVPIPLSPEDTHSRKDSTNSRDERLNVVLVGPRRSRRGKIQPLHCTTTTPWLRHSTPTRGSARLACSSR